MKKNKNNHGKAGKRRGKRVWFICLLLLAAAGITAGLLCRHPDKEKQLALFQAPSGQKVYILGTLHFMHFQKSLRFSMADIVTCADRVQPDVVFLEAREKTWLNYGVIDGPIDMLLMSAYCTENYLPVRLIDWWELDDSAKSNSTDQERDDHIFQNIEHMLAETAPDQTILIVCGSTHLHEQSRRMLDNGYTRIRIEEPGAYFSRQTSGFEYPSAMAAIIEKKITYLQNDFPREIDAGIRSEKVKADWRQQNTSLINSLEKALQYVKEQRLYGKL